MENLCTLCQSRLVAIKKSQLCFRCYQRVRNAALKGPAAKLGRKPLSAEVKEERLRLKQQRRDEQEAATLERHRTIIEMVLAGATLRTTAKEQGVSYKQVYRILKRHGVDVRALKKATKPLRPTKPTPEQRQQMRVEKVRGRFLSCIEVDPITRCWNWTGARDVPNRQYPNSVLPRMVAYDPMDARLARKTSGHRVAYMLYVGPIPRNMSVARTCFNSLCCNPEHMVLLTKSEAGQHKNPNKPPLRVPKTHCRHGHEYSLENSYWTPQGIRLCRACLRDRERERYHRSRGS